MRHVISIIFILLPYLCWSQTDSKAIIHEQNQTSIIQAAPAGQYIEALTINHKNAVFDKSGNLYLQTIAESYINQEDLTAAVSFKLTSSAGGCQMTIEDTALANGGHFTFKDFREGRIFTIKLVDKKGQVVVQTQLAFTFMPIAEITGSNFNRDNYTKGFFRLTDANSTQPDLLRYAKFRYRGNVASSKQKKAYNVKITDEKGKSADVSFFGLREDNSWILDAMAIDPARMRNRVSTDLWNDFSTAPYFFNQEPEAHNGTRGHFIEVFLNDSYIGIYCMTEKIDRKQLKLKKIQKGEPASVRGVLYKADQWSYSLLMGHDPDKLQYPMRKARAFNNQQEVWDGWEIKHPDLGDGEPIDWTPLYNAVNVPASYPDVSFKTAVGDFFDLPVLRDYYLFIELMLATDNHGKNLFLHAYNIQENKKLSITPWDLDGTWGRRWDGKKDLTQNAYQDFIRFLWNYEHGENTLYKRLKELDVDQWNEKLDDRYAELRTGYFSRASLTNRFHQYHQLFKISGADGREEQRWNGTDGVHLNFEQEMEYLDNWINNRLIALDRAHGYSPTGTKAPAVQKKELTVGGGVGKIIVHTPQPVVLHIYNITGQFIGTYHKECGTSEIAVKQPGLYIVNRQKVIVW